MSEVVAPYPYAPESSIQISRPHFSAFLQPDTNAGGTNVYQNNDREEYRRLHVPTATGPPDFKMTCCTENDGENLSVEAAEKFEFLNARKPYEMGIVDPVSGFLSPAGEVLLNTGKTIIQTMGKQKKEPHTTIPRNVNSIRDYQEAIDEIKREAFGKTDPVLYWNSRKVPDAIIRARLGGWTSTHDMRKKKTVPEIDQHKVEDIFPNKNFIVSRGERDALAKKFQWTSSTQSAYEEVHWDQKLVPRQHAPVTTFENGKPDPVVTTSAPPARPEIWQTAAGKAWDRLQERKTYFTKQPVEFKSPTKRGDQIPGYGGCLGGVNIEYMDDVIEKFEPFTHLRNDQPKIFETNYKPNIPGYTGNVHNFKTTQVSHYDNDGRPYTTYSAFYRKLPMIDQKFPDIPSLSGDFARIQTKVPPENPYNLIYKPTDPYVNHSLDQTAIKHAIVNPKKRNHQDYVELKKAVLHH